MTEPNPYERLMDKNKGSGFQFTFRVLESYGVCPQKYAYQQVENISDNRDRSFVRFHTVLHATLAWMNDIFSQGGNPPPIAEVEEMLNHQWSEIGARNTPFEAIYRARSIAVTKRFWERLLLLPLGIQLVMRPILEVTIPGGVVMITADEAEYVIDTALLNTQDVIALTPSLVRFYKFGRPSDEHYLDDRILLLRSAGYEAINLWYPLHSPQPLEVQTKSPQRADTIERHVQKVAEQAAGLLQGKYTPRPQERECRRCGYKFNCRASKN